MPKSSVALLLVDAVIIVLTLISNAEMILTMGVKVLIIALIPLVIFLTTFYFKGIYSNTTLSLKNTYRLFEAIVVATAILSIPMLLLSFSVVTTLLLFCYAIYLLVLLFAVRVVFNLILNCFNKKAKNVLIVGAGQDGKVIAEEIQSRPELGLKVVGFLDDNMNTIEDEDSTIPILGLTCDSEAVIKDNNVKLVIIAVKSRMDSAILTDLVKGIPLGVKTWRMPKFYEKITKKYFISKMTVNWLFYACVKKKALLFAYIKRFCDIIASVLIMILTSPLSLIAAIGIKFSDFGPVFYTQTRIGKFGRPFKMLKFRTMYQDTVNEDFDEDVNEVRADDKRIMPFCRVLRKFHIDELPQMINVLRGEMSIIGPRPVREEVYYENKERIPFWECRNWVRPGWCGWQQVNTCEPQAEERLEYDLYYIKHRNTLWEFAILMQYITRVLTGKCK